MFRKEYNKNPCHVTSKMKSPRDYARLWLMWSLGQGVIATVFSSVSSLTSFTHLSTLTTLLKYSTSAHRFREPFLLFQMFDQTFRNVILFLKILCISQQFMSWYTKVTIFFDMFSTPVEGQTFLWPDPNYSHLTLEYMVET